jgi:Flp pilus assembly protein TadB
MIEVIIFYSYIILEFCTAVLIFASMYRAHQKRVKEEMERAAEMPV